MAALRDLDLVIVGGCGHVGLPLALSLADCGYTVGINDIDQAKIEMVRAGNVPFRETGAEELLRKMLPTGRLELSRDPVLVRRELAGAAAPAAGQPVPALRQRGLVEGDVEQQRQVGVEARLDQALEKASCVGAHAPDRARPLERPHVQQDGRATVALPR